MVGTMTVDLREYPARDISWDATADPNANPERPPYVVLSNPKDQAYMNVPVNLVFDLTTDCDKLKQFHRDLGTKYEAWKGGADNGWVKLLDYVVGQPLEQTLLAISPKYTYQQIWNDQAVREEYRKAIQDALPEASKQKAGNDYFTGFTVTIGQPYPQDQRLIDLRANEQSALSEARTNEIKLTADAQAREKAAKANENAANAEVAAKEAEARKRAAEIRAFGEGPAALDAYLREQCQEKNGTCKQYDPAPVIVGAGGVVNP